MSALILLGSARSNGFTGEAAARLARRIGPEAELVDLLPLRIHPFRYEGASENDDFPTLVERLLRHRAIVFATPVYWYAMSAVMKNFFDRFTDLLGPGEMGGRARALAGRRTWLLSTGTEVSAPDGFEIPFQRTSAYLGMTWMGGCYLQRTPSNGIDAEAASTLGDFAARVAVDRQKDGPEGPP